MNADQNAFSIVKFRNGGFRPAQLKLTLVMSGKCKYAFNNLQDRKMKGDIRRTSPGIVLV